MKLAVISDMHFGDPDCILVERKNDGWKLREHVTERLKWLHDLDVLILLGDIFDFSIAAYQEAIAAAIPFFDWLREGGKVGHVVYCPGNHDAMMWHALEYETRVTGSLRSERVAKPLRSSQPCLIDTTKSEGWISLPGVHDPGDVFLKDLISIPTYVAYPNIYVRTATGTVLMTHGHYFETYWAALGELVQKLGADDNVTHPDLHIPGIDRIPTIKQLVDCNHPLVTLACMGIGQAGDLTTRARQIQHEAKRDHITSDMLLDKYLLRLQHIVATRLERDAKWYQLGRKVANAVVEKCLDAGFEYIRKQIGEAQPVRVVAASKTEESWLARPDVNPRFERYMLSAKAEAASHGIPAPTSCVFGHTHTHESWPTTVNTPSYGALSCCNTGGWLSEQEAYVLLFDGAFSLERALFV